jgi:hypothetical protein
MLARIALSPGQPSTAVSGWSDRCWGEIRHSLNEYRLGYDGIERIRVRVGIGEVGEVRLRIWAGEWAGIGDDVRRFAGEAAGEKAIMRRRGRGDAIDEHNRGKACALRSVAPSMPNPALRARAIYELDSSQSSLWRRPPSRLVRRDRVKPWSASTAA